MVVVAHRPVVVVAHRLAAVGLVVDDKMVGLAERVLVLADDDSRPIRDCPGNVDRCIVDRIDRRRIGPHHRHRSCLLSTLVELVQPKVHVVVLVGLLANDRPKLGNCK